MRGGGWSEGAEGPLSARVFFQELPLRAAREGGTHRLLKPWRADRGLGTAPPPPSYPRVERPGGVYPTYYNAPNMPRVRSAPVFGSVKPLPRFIASRLSVGQVHKVQS
jgi:hypothetical protein